MVTIVITVYNRLAFLARAVRSALDQTYSNIELVVVDDGSAIDVKIVLEPFGDLLRFYGKPNGGQASARNFGMAHAHGEFILFLDDDDFLEPHAVKELTEALREKSGACWAVGRFAYVNEYGERLPKQHRARWGYLDAYREMIRENLVGAPSVLLARTDVVRSLGGFDEDRAVQLCEDYDLWLSLAKTFPVAALPRIVSNYRVYPGQATSNWGAHYDAWLTVLRKQKCLARPAYAKEFDRSIAAIQMEYGDSLYLSGKYVEARNLWQQAYRESGLTSLAYWIRRAKSRFPNSVLRFLRQVRQMAIPASTRLNL